MSVGNIILFSAFIQNIILNKVYGIDTFNKPLKTKKYNIILGILLISSVLLVFILANLLNKYFLAKIELTIIKPFLIIVGNILMIPLMILINEKIFKEPKKYNAKKSLILLSNMISLGIIIGSASNIFNAFYMILGYILMVVLIKNVEVKLITLKMPKALKGYPILLISIGLISAIISRYI